jgi:hypothetical protein
MKNILSHAFGLEPYRFIVSIRKLLLHCMKTIVRTNYRQETVLLLLGILTTPARYDKFKPLTPTKLTRFVRYNCIFHRSSALLRVFSSADSEQVVQAIVSYLCANGVLKDLAAILKAQVSRSSSEDMSNIISSTVGTLTAFFRQEWATQATRGTLTTTGAQLSASLLVGALSLPLPSTVVTSTAPLRPATALALDYFDEIMASSKWDLSLVSESNFTKHLSLLENIGLVMEAFADAVDSTSLVRASSFVPVILRIEVFFLIQYVVFIIQGKFLSAISSLGEKLHQFSAQLRELANSSFVSAANPDDADVMDIVPSAESERLIQLSESIGASLASQYSKLFQRPSFRQLCAKLAGDSAGSNLPSFLAISRLARIASTVVTDKDLVVQIYEAISGPLVPLWASLRDQIKINSTNMSDQTRGLLGLFCRSYTYMLQDALDDNEFFEKQVPFSLQVVIEMVQLLKVCFKSAKLRHGNLFLMFFFLAGLV